MSGIINDYWTIDASGDWNNGANWYQVVTEPAPVYSETLNVQPNVGNDAEIDPSGTTPFAVSYDETDAVNALDGDAYATLDLIGGTLTVQDGGGWNGDFFNTGGTFDAVTGWAAYGSTGLATGATDEVDSGVFAIGSGTLSGNLTGQGEFLLLGGDNFMLDPGLSITSGTLDLAVNGDGFGSNTTLATDVDYAGTFLLNDYAGNAANLFLNGYMLTLSGTQNLNGYISGGGELALSGTAEISELTLNDSVTVEVSGTVIQDGLLTTGNGSAPDNTVIDVGTAGTWDIAGDTGINGYGDATFVNSGLLEKTSGSGASYFGGSVFTSSGTILAAAGQLYLTAGNNVLEGSIGGGGELIFAGGDDFTIATGAPIDVATLDLAVNGDGFGSNTTLAADVAYAGTFLLNNYAGNAANLFLNGYTLTLSGMQNLNGYISGDGALSLAGTAEITGLTMNDSVIVEVSGTVIQSAGLTTGNGTAPDDSLYEITQTGTWDITSDTYFNCDGNTTINNAGLFEKTGGTSYINIGANFTNASTGTIEVGGSLGSDLSFLGSQNVFAGTITGPGYFYLGGGGSDTLAAGAVVSNLAAFTVSDNNTQLTLEGSRTFAFTFTAQNGAAVILEADQTFTSDFNELNSASFGLNGNNLTLSGTATLDGYVFGPGTLEVTNQATLAGFQAGGSVAVDILGTVDQQSQVYYGAAPTDAIQVTIAAGAVYDLSDDSNINTGNTAYDGDATITNAGLLEASGTGTSVIYTDVVNTGTILAASGALDLESIETSTLAGTITGPGALVLGRNDFLIESAVLDVSALVVAAGSVTLEENLNYAGMFTDDSGTTVYTSSGLYLNGYNLTLSGTAALNGYVAGPGTLDLTNQASLDRFTGSDGLALDILGTVDQAGFVQYGTGPNDTMQVSIAAGAVYDLTTNDWVNNPNTNDDGDATITNAGLLEKTAGTGTSTIYTDVVNTGTILVASGVLDLESIETSTLEGTITGPGALVLGRNDFLIDTAVLDVSVLIVAASSVTLEENLNYGGAFNDNSGTTDYSSTNVNLNGYNLTLGGTGYVRSAVYGGGTLDIAGTLDVGGLYLASGTEELVTGTAIQDNYDRLDYDGGAAASVLSIASTGTYDVTGASLNIDYNNTRGTIINAGLFENTATAGSFFQIYDNFTNTSTGTLYAGPGQNFSLYGTSNDLAGTVTGNYLSLASGTTTLEAGLVLATSGLGVNNGATFLLEDSRFFAGEFDDQSGANLDLNGYNLTLTGDGSVRSYSYGGGTLDLGGALYIGQQALGSGTDELVTGIAVQDGEIRLNYDGGTAASVLSIAAGGIYDITADQAIDNSGASAIINAGLFEKTGFNGNTIIFVNLTNAATGTIFIEAGEELSLQADNNDLAGTVSGAYLNLAAGVTTLESALALDVAEIGLAANATLQLAGNQAYAGAFDEAFGADLDLAGNNLTLSGEGSLPSYVYGGGTLNIAGTLALDGEGLASATDELITGTALQDQGGYDVRLDQDDGTASSVLSIAAGGTYDIIVNQWIDNDTRNDGLGTGTLINAGLLEKTGGAGAEDSVGTPGNSDIWTDFTNASTGTISVVAGTQISLRGETDDLAGTITGAGALLIGQGGTATLEAGLSISAGSLVFSDSGTDVLLESDRTFDAAFSLQDGATIDLNGYTLNLAGTSGLYADLQGPGALDVSGNADIDGLYLSAGAELLDTGTITEIGLLQLGIGATDSATLSIASNAVYDLLNDNGYGIGASGTVGILNAGLFEKTGFTGTSTMGPAFTNSASGTVAALSGVLAFAGSLDNDGLVTISGGTLITNGAVGADSGDTGTFVLGPNAVLDETGGVAASQTIAMTGAGDELILGGGTTFQGEVTGFAPGDVIDLQGVTANGLLYENNILTLAENGSFVTSLAIAGLTGPSALGLVYYNAGGTDIVLGNAVSGSIAVDSWSAAGSGDFNNADNWSLSAAPGPLDVAAIFVGNNSGNDLVITDSQSSTIYALSDSDDSDTFLQTAGTLTVLDGGGYYVDNASQFDGALDQSAGAELVSGFGGAVIFYNGGTVAGTLAGAGNISFEATGPAANESVTLSATAALDVASLGIGDQGVGNITLVLGGNIGYAGFLKVGNAFNFNGSYIDLQGYTLSLGGNAVFNSGNGGGRLVGTGTVLLGGSATFIGYGIEDGVLLDVTGTLIDQNALDIGNADTDSSTVSIASSGTLDLTADSNIYGSNYQGMDGGSIYNAGLIEKTGDNGQSNVNNINITQAASGILDVKNGVLNINDGFVNGPDTYDDMAGTIEGAGEVEFDNLNVTFAPSLALHVAGLDVNGANVTLAGSLGYNGKFSEENGGGLALNGDNFTLGGTAALDGYVAGAGTLQVTGLGDANNLTVQQGAVLLDAGTITQDGGLHFYDTAAMSIASGAVFDIVNDSGISGQGDELGTIANAGLFEKTASTGDTQIYASFTQGSTGTLEVASGDVQFFDQSDVVGGTFTGGGEIEFDNNRATENATLAAGLVLNIAVLGVYANTTLGGNLAYGGDLILNDNALDLNGQTLNLTGASSALDSGYLTGGGVLEVSGTATENGLNLDGGSDLLVTGRVNQIGQLGFGGGDPYSSQPSNTLAIAAGGIYNLQNDSGLSEGNHDNETVTNAGLLEKTGDTGTSEVSATFANTGTVLATSGALQFDNITNLAAGTLTSGTYVSDNTFIGAAIDFAPGLLLDDAASITLSGAGSEIYAGGTAIEQSLTSISSVGVLALLGSRGFSATNSLVDDGNVQLAGGIFSTTSLLVGATGTLFGYGTVVSPITDNGLIEVTDPTLSIEGSVNGSGGLLIAASSELILGAGVANGTHITFGGSDAELQITDTVSMQAAINGFNNTDQIVVDNLTGATDSYVTGTGLVLTSGTTTLTLDIQGSLAADDFILTSAGSNTLIDLTLSTIVTDGSSVYVPSGTTVSNPIVFSGGYEEVEAGGTDDTPTLSGGTLELVYGAAVGGNISFTGTGGDLIIDPSSGGTTTIPANTLTGFTAGDTIELSGVPYDAANDSYTVATAGTVTIDADGSFYNIIIAGVTVGQDNFVLSGDLELTEAACYAAGTRIATAVGEVEVEDLEIGDYVETLDGSLQKIKWIGHRSYDGRFIAGNKDILPIRITKGAIAENIPSRDLFVSPGHAICIDNALIHAFRLVNGVSITQIPSVESVTYYHIETENHEVIFAENCPAETFLDENFRAQFQNVQEFRTLYPNHVATNTTCLPLLQDGFALHAIRQRLNARANILPAPETPGKLRGYVDEPGPAICTGWAQDLENPETPVCLDILVDGTRVAQVLANFYRADLRNAGLGSGCHAFRAVLPAGIAGPLEIRRASDGAEIPWTETALAWTA